MTITPLKNAEGDVNQFIAIKQDITARKQAENDRARLLSQVREQAQRIQQIMDTVPAGVLLLNGQGEVILANPTAERHLSILATELQDSTLSHLGDHPLTDLLTVSSATGQRFEIHNTGQIFEVISRPMQNDSNPDYWVLIINDITKVREQQRYQQAQERLATVGQLAAGIAHDFNNVMGVIVLYTQLLQNKGNISAESQKYLTMIINQANHAAELIGQILDFSRRSIMEQSPLNLLYLLKEHIKLLERTLPENIQLNLTYDQQSYTIMADPTRLQQVLMNLSVNARDAMQEGGHLNFILSAINVKSEEPPPLPDMEPGAWVQLAISDTGTGIFPEHLSHLFEPFFTTKEAGRGTGLGLAQVYGIIKQHNGVIDIQSQVGKGSTFLIYLPLSVSSSPAETVAPTEKATTGGSETVLLVEDNPAMRLSLVDVLEALGYQVITAVNGIAALDVLKQNHAAINLICSDLVMPEMGGLELYHAVQQQYPGKKFMIMTGYPLEAKPGELFSDTSVEWLTKPFNAAVLAEKIRAVLDAGS